MKRVVCETGGKNAIVVDDDADLDDAVTGVLRSAFGYAGQKCSACSRVIVVGEAYKPFLERLAAACRSLRNTHGGIAGLRRAAGHRRRCQGPPRPDHRPIRDPAPACSTRGRRPRAATSWRRPSSRSPTASMRLMQEELFGPVLAAMRAETFEEALDIALSTPFALTGAVFTRSPSHLERARERFRVGNLYLNRGSTGALVERQPFGGFGLSGLGTKAGGPGYLPAFRRALLHHRKHHAPRIRAGNRLSAVPVPCSGNFDFHPAVTFRISCRLIPVDDLTMTSLSSLSLLLFGLIGMALVGLSLRRHGSTGGASAPGRDLHQDLDRLFCGHRPRVAGAFLSRPVPGDCSTGRSRKRWAACSRILQGRLRLLDDGTAAIL